MRPECGLALRPRRSKPSTAGNGPLSILISYLKRAFLFTRRLWAPQQEDIVKAICQLQNPSSEYVFPC
jgi:hypothetical protein